MNQKQRPQEVLHQIDVGSQLSDMKEIDYRNTLAIASIIEVLLEKNIITREDISKKAAFLDQYAFDELDEKRDKTI